MFERDSGKNNPVTGAAFLLDGIRLIRVPGLRVFVVGPFLINILLFGGLIWFGFQEFGALVDGLVPAEGWLSYLRWLLWPLFALTVLLVVIFLFTLLANLIAAPFNGLLSEKVEEFLTGQPAIGGDNWRRILADFLPSVLSELRKITYFALRAIPLLLLFLIPVVNIVAPFLWFLFNAWYLSLEYCDYPMANQGMRFAEQHRRLKKTRLTSIGFGGAVLLLMMTPLLNLLVIPAAVAGATLYWHEQLSRL